MKGSKFPYYFSNALSTLIPRFIYRAQATTSEHRSMYSYVRLSIIDVHYVRLFLVLSIEHKLLRLSIDRCTATYV